MNSTNQMMLNMVLMSAAKTELEEQKLEKPIKPPKEVPKTKQTKQVREQLVKSVQEPVKKERLVDSKPILATSLGLLFLILIMLKLGDN